MFTRDCDSDADRAIALRQESTTLDLLCRDAERRGRPIARSSGSQSRHVVRTTLRPSSRSRVSICSIGARAPPSTAGASRTRIAPSDGPARRDTGPPRPAQPVHDVAILPRELPPPVGLEREIEEVRARIMYALSCARLPRRDAQGGSARATGRLARHASSSSPRHSLVLDCCVLERRLRGHAPARRPTRRGRRARDRRELVRRAHRLRGRVRRRRARPPALRRMRSRVRGR